jgi:hypothetical protein
MTKKDHTHTKIAEKDGAYLRQNGAFLRQNGAFLRQNGSRPTSQQTSLFMT